MPYISDRLGGVRMIRRDAAPLRNSPLTMMGVGGCGMGEDWTAYGQPAPPAVASATPAAPAEPSFWDRFSATLSSMTMPTSPTVPASQPVYVAPVQSGMSTTTKIALAGGALLLVAMIARR